LRFFFAACVLYFKLQNIHFFFWKKFLVIVTIWTFSGL
jgi:hypothetical protein